MYLKTLSNKVSRSRNTKSEEESISIVIRMIYFHNYKAVGTWGKRT